MDFPIARSYANSTCQLSTTKSNRDLESGSPVGLGPFRRLQQIENVEVESLISQKTKRSQRSQVFRKSSTSVASYKENLVEMQAKKAAIQRKLKFAVTIVEQQQRLNS